MKKAILLFLSGVLLFVHASSTPLPDNSALDDFPAGNYQAADSSYLALFRAQLGPAFLNYGSGRLGILHSLGEDRFVAGPGAMGWEPVEVDIELVRNAEGEVQGLIYIDSTGASHRYTRQPLPGAFDVSIPHESIVLAATLTLPAGKGPFPALVMNHGGGPGLRQDLRLWTYFFSLLGYAVLTYDKRGCGETIGADWETFEDLADDTVAATQWLKRHPAIDSKRTGIWAYSQSGWIVSLAARREPVSFVLAVSAPALSPAGRALASVRPRLLADGYSPSEVEAASEFIAAVNAFGRNDLSWDEYERLLNQARQARWYDRVEKPTSEDAPSTSFYKSGYGRYFDPLPFWSSLGIPVLAIYGGLDTTVPAEANASLLSQAMVSNPNSTVLVFPNANHQMLRARTGGDDELIDLNHYVAGYFKIMKWFMQDVLTRPRENAGARVSSGGRSGLGRS
ncbi:MAG: alpha/beta fold hydrolase [Candidatus Aminicenantales bacterium]